MAFDSVAVNKAVESAEQLAEDEQAREDAMLKAKVSHDEDETTALEREMIREENSLSKDRKLEKEEEDELAAEVKLGKKGDAKKLAKLHGELEKEKKLMEQEENKLREERQKLLTVERDEALAKEEEGDLVRPAADLACFVKCLPQLHNVLACKKRCAAAKKIAIINAKAGITTTRPKALPTHAPSAPCTGTCYGALPKGTCCNTCEDVQAAYAHRNWALPPLDHIAQCKGRVAKAQNSHIVVGAHRAIFTKPSAGKKQQETNRLIQNLMFKKLHRLTETKAHFVPAKKAPAKPTVHVINPNIRKWEEYRLKRLAEMHSMVTGKKPLEHGGMMLPMSRVNMRKWANLKVHHWMLPQKLKILRRMGVHNFVAQKFKLQKTVAAKINKAHKTVDTKIDKGVKGARH